MDRPGFLDRIIAPGQFLAVTAKPANGAMVQRLYPRKNIAAADRFLQGQQDSFCDSWYAMASFLASNSRKQENVEAIKCFWYDADVMRQGDGKDATKAFASQTDVLFWVKQFGAATGLPLPNLWVCSGYGFHLYWLMEDALDLASWQPYAEALKAALIAHGARGDASVVADGARILRPIGSLNFKDPANPVPTYELDRLTKPDYPNAMLLNAIKALPSFTINVKPGLTGIPPQPAAGLTSNARKNIARRPYHFDVIASHCGQVARSLDEGGANDGRQIWHTLVTLARFCADGRYWAHEVGNQHPQYTTAGTDKEYDQTEAEYERKGFGAPRCKSFDAERPGICDLCPHKDDVSTPFSLGLPDESPDKLPPRWRRVDGTIQQRNDGKWHHLLDGDVYDPALSRAGGHLRISFSYEDPTGKVTRVHVDNVEIETRTSKRVFSDKGVALNLDNDRSFGRLVLAWIEQLQRAGTINEAAPPFGWHEVDGDLAGFSIGGLCYGSEDVEFETGGCDPTLARYYKPRGDIDRWREAAELVIDNRPEFQVAFAASLGAPLMRFSGENCLCIAFVGESGRGKSSVFKAGAAAWGHPVNTMAQLDDTANSVSLRIGDVVALPVYWDEVKIKAQEIKELVHKLSQGRDKGRVTADIKMRPVGEWKTLFPLASNDSLVAALASLTGDNAATLLRILEIPLDKVGPVQMSVQGSATVASLDYNYGHAGPLFIKAIVQLTDKLPSLVQRFKTALITATNATDSNERFYIAGGAVVLAAAFIADRMQLVTNLNLAAMQRVLVDAIVRARGTRTDLAMMSPREKAIFYLDKFCAEYNKQCIVTKFIPTTPAAVTNAGNDFVRKVPMSDDQLAYHVGVDDATMRVNKELWTSWCNKLGLSPDMLIGQTWYRDSKRAVIGAGSMWKIRVRTIELNLNDPDIAYLTEDFNQTTNKVVALPKRP
jgi:Domain of unknown function (DUF927)